MIALEERFSRSLPVRFTADELRGKAVEQPIDVPVPADSEAEPASIDDGVLDHDGGGMSHEAEE